MGEALIHNTYSAQSWAEQVEEGEYIPQAAMDLEAEYGGFSDDPSLLFDSPHGGSPPPNFKGWGSFNNSSTHGVHGGCASREIGTRVAHGNQVNQKVSPASFDKVAFPELQSAYVSKSHGISAVTKVGCGSNVYKAENEENSLVKTWSQGSDGSVDSALYATENSRLPQSYSVLQQNTQATPLHTNSSISAVASQANSTCPLAAAPFHMQGDALATNYANRQAFRSSNSAAGVHSVEGSFGDGAPITYSTSAVCTRAATSNTNGLEPTVQSTLGLRDLPNTFSDAVRPVANQVGEEIP
ncbi:hypothetical protein F0562_032279 [Nyssa sinensis]|uniref:Uncharacterized protein n=1 Tax=Nyssa sinensis TaxID=561372 RepID=A0A5J5AR16_9ASTE|nr:hypothetical protein F0562_032279 [Nyssa sinensis]